MEFFGYFQKKDYGTHAYPELLYKMKEKYKKSLIDPTGGKEPLKYREYTEANEENIKKNSKYQLDYRKKKCIEINAASNLPEMVLIE